jgi:hypothetical protein
LKLIGPIETALLSRYQALFEGARAKGVLEFDNALVPRAQSLREMTGADLLLLLDLNEKNAAFQVPSKLLDYIRAGRPILAYTPSNSPVARILEQSGIPHAIISPTKPEPVADARLREFLSRPSGPYEPSQWFKDQFGASAQARSVAELLDSLIAHDKMVKATAT